MNNQEINKRIALLCGWEKQILTHGFWKNPNSVSGFIDVPNYTKSLDCCREFESKLTSDDRSMYMDFIYLHIVRTNNEAVMGFENQWAIFNATPLQRCEAFLRMKGQWE